MRKRQKFIITSLTLSLGFISLQLLPDSYRFINIGILGILTLILFAWSLREGLGLNMTLLSLVLPVLFTLGVGLFWFLLPTHVFTRIPIVLFYGIGIYALCLTTNIYTVSAIRTIALLRAASGVGFVLSLLTFFLLFDTILSIHWPIYTSSTAVFISSIPLFLQGYWSVKLEKKISFDIILVALISSLVTGEIATILFFWPTGVVVGSLFLTITSYMLLGLGQAELEGRLFIQTIREYLLIGIFVSIGMFIATRWGV